MPLTCLNVSAANGSSSRNRVADSLQLECIARLVDHAHFSRSFFRPSRYLDREEEQGQLTRRDIEPRQSQPFQCLVR